MPGPPITPQIVFGSTDLPMLVARDLNIHHLTSDCTHILSDKEFQESHPFLFLASGWSFNLLNMPGVYTRFSFTSDKRPSMLDLAFTSTRLFSFLGTWSTPYSSTG